MNLAIAVATCLTSRGFLDRSMEPGLETLFYTKTSFTLKPFKKSCWCSPYAIHGSISQISRAQHRAK